MKKSGMARIALLAAALVALGTTTFAESEIIKLEGKASYYGEEFNGKPTSSGEIFDMNAFTAAHKTLPFGTLLEVTNLENGKKVTVRVNDRGPFVDDRDLDMSKAAAAEIGILGAGTARVSIRKVGMADTNAVATTTAPAANGDAIAQPTAVTEATNGTASATTTGATTGAAETNVTSTPATGSATNATTVGAPSATAQPAQAAASVTAVTTPAATGATGAAVQNSPAPTLAATASPTGPRWRIQLGSFSREDNATRLVVRLRKDGFNPAFEKTATTTRVVIAGISNGDLAGIRGKLDHAGYTGYIVRQEAW
jgi:rare lipoprotein A